MPPGLRKSGMPDSVLMPAPVRTTSSRAEASTARARSNASSISASVPRLAPSVNAGRIPGGPRRRQPLRPGAPPPLGQKVPFRHRPHVAPALAELADDGRLEARVHEAVLAARVFALLPVVPVDVVPELFPRGVVLVADQVAGALPAERRARDVAPRRARVVALAGRELEKQRRVVHRVDLRELEHALELLVDLLPEEEVIPPELLVVITGGYEHALHAEVREELHHVLDLLDRGFLEDRRVRAD